MTEVKFPVHPAIQVTFKTLWLYLLLLLFTRAIGKKLLSQMTFFDFVTGVTIGAIAGAYITIGVPGIWVLLSPAVLTVAVVATGFLTFASLKARKWIEGEPVVVIQNGKILEQNMLKLRYNIDDLEMQLRSKDVFDITQVEFAVVEGHGQLSVQKKSQYLPVTPADLGLATQYKGLASEIIRRGDVMEQNLRQNGLDFKWLYSELNKLNVKNIEDIVLATLQTDGTLYVDMREDALDYVQKVED